MTASTRIERTTQRYFVKLIPFVCATVGDSDTDPEMVLSLGKNHRLYQTIYDTALTFVTNVATLDPSPNKQYLEWIISRFVRIPWQDLPYIWFDMCGAGFDVSDHEILDDTAFEALHLFHHNKSAIDISKRDINQYKTFEQFVKDGSSFAQLSNRRIKQDIKNQDVEVVYDHPTLVVYSIKSVAAMRLYGAGTTWCVNTITQQDSFNEYIKGGGLYLFIDRRTTNLNKKYLLSLNTGEFHNERNRSISSVTDKLPKHRYIKAAVCRCIEVDVKQFPLSYNEGNISNMIEWFEMCFASRWTATQYKRLKQLEDLI